MAMGTFSGNVVVANVTPRNVKPEFSLKNAHTGVVRTVMWQSHRLITGGEDARLCIWKRPTAVSATMHCTRSDDLGMGEARTNSTNFEKSISRQRQSGKQIPRQHFGQSRRAAPYR